LLIGFFSKFGAFVRFEELFVRKKAAGTQIKPLMNFISKKGGRQPFSEPSFIERN